MKPEEYLVESKKSENEQVIIKKEVTSKNECIRAITTILYGITISRCR